MPTVTKNDHSYPDGVYVGFCPKCKAKRDFAGIVRLTDTNRVLAEGPCAECSTPITKVLA